MPIFDSFQPASFLGQGSFPVDEIEIVGGLRDHIHEYPHSDGGAPEKLGRKLYTIRLSGLFQNRFLKYPNLYPGTLNALIASFEAGTTGDLVVPTVGTIQAYCRSWKRSATAKIRSGEKMDLEFVEDMNSAFQINQLIDSSSTTLASAVSVMTANRSLIANFLEAVQPAAELLDSLESAANAAIAVVDQASLATQLVEAKLLAVADLANKCDQALSVDPGNAIMLSSIRDVWDSAATQAANILQNQTPLRIYDVPSLMAITDVARRIYGDASRAVEILQLNDVDDAFRIPAGQKLRYYPVAA